MAKWQQAARARNDLADLVESLTDEQLAQPTLCEGWTAKEVLAHVLSFVETGGFSFFARIAKARGDFSKASAAMVAERIDRPVADLAASLRAKADTSSPVPIFPEAMTVSDCVIHAQDVRRPLGLGAPPDDLVDVVLTFLTTHRLATTMVDRRPIEGVRLVATDRDWSFGDGLEIRGTAEAIMMGLGNRSVLADLEGEGLASWS